MRPKRLLSACLVLALCLSLLPVTALAADGGTVYVGGVTLSGSTDSPAYATTDDNGTVTIVDASADKYNIKWDGSTLTLDGAKIKGGTSSESLYATVGIYAFSNSGDVSLNIALKGVNEIFESSNGIWVYSSSDNAGAVTLTIEGEGSLNASGSSSGILVQSNSGDATLTIQNADVTAENSSSSGDGVTVRAGSSSSASLSVDGGSLTATGKNESGAGIRYTFGSSSSGSGKPSLTVSGNAMVKASGDTGGITSNSSTVTPSGTGIVFNNGTGTVYGNVTLQEDLTVENGQTLTIPDGASLTIDNGATLTNEGTVTTTDGGTLTNNGTINNSGTLPDNIQGTAPPGITTTSLDDGAENTAYTATLAADGEPTSWTWSAAAGSNTPPGLTLNNDGTITGAPTAAGTYSFTVTATNDYGSDSKEFILTIDQQGTIHVTSVSLDKTSLELTEGETTQLTATVLPDNASNKNVTWESSNTNVATVDANGVVTAVSEGTATITATADGKSTTCAVTVRAPYVPPATYAVTLPGAGHGTVTASHSRASRGTTVTLTAAPDEGYELESLTVLDSRGSEIALTDQGGGRYTFTMPGSQVTVSAAFVCGGLTENCPSHAFTDVDTAAWYHLAVDYALENGLMEGVSDALFDPDGATTRAQVVTILWRLEGQPAAETVPAFDDVDSGAWFAEAVAWAAEQGIVSGVSGAAFAPDDPVTREQLAAILYRYAVYKGYDVSIGEDTNILSYADFGQISEYAIPAMQWACGAGIVSGTSESTLTPQGEAARAQVAAMLQRFLETAAQ